MQKCIVHFSLVSELTSGSGSGSGVLFLFPEGKTINKFNQFHVAEIAMKFLVFNDVVVGSLEVEKLFVTHFASSVCKCTFETLWPHLCI